ncbi:Alpha/beta-hydrolase [Pleurostoma richardsiae]|uniref:Alpha/beta-hydrolase n=1 Tax=Pleurostoma richardsiae TaxID=41990 RepID=A0AA38RU05_9PEZI|nr:Alpha/beta-hydrolase [Pleurostoma richardsiae]
MDAVYAKIAEDTVKFNLGDEEVWRQLFEPLYKEPSSDVTVLRDERYGPAERNRLDVFFSRKGIKDPSKPVLVFVHGGGFFSGDKAWSEKCWANIGNYFAEHGMVVVLVNHQLVPHVQYPGGADDIQLVREWIFSNIAAEKFGRGSLDKVVLFGHSSGGAHIMSNLCAAGDPSRPAKDPLFPPVAGVILLDAPFWFDREKPLRQRIIRQYYGSDAEAVWGPLCPLGLFQALPEDSPVLDSAKLPIYVGSVKWEVKETADANVAFFNAYRARSKPVGTLPVFHVLDKHNHLSNVLSIGTEDEAQARMLLNFISSCTAKKDARVKL